MYSIEAGQRVRGWLIAALDGKLVTVHCDCGHRFQAHASTIANRIARAGSRSVYCNDQCGLRRAALHLRSLAATAKKRGITVDLTVEEVFALRVGKECIYCGGKLPSHGGGLDRMDNSRGYSVDNVVPCCADCNTAKSSFFSFDEFMAAMRVRTELVGCGNAWPQRATRYPPGKRSR